jgi:hypothetical protein
MHECSACRGEKIVHCVTCSGTGKRFVGFYIRQCKECAGAGKRACDVCGVQAPFKLRHDQTDPLPSGGKGWRSTTLPPDHHGDVHWQMALKPGPMLSPVFTYRRGL